MTIYYLRNIISARITYFQGFPIKYFMYYIILFKMLIYQSQKYLPTSIFANFQKVGLNHIIFLFLFLFFWS